MEGVRGKYIYHVEYLKYAKLKIVTNTVIIKEPIEFKDYPII